MMLGGGPQMTKFEQDSRDAHHIPQGRSPWVWCSWRVPCLTFPRGYPIRPFQGGGTLPCDLSMYIWYYCGKYRKKSDYWFRDVLYHAQSWSVYLDLRVWGARPQPCFWALHREVMHGPGTMLWVIQWVPSDHIGWSPHWSQPIATSPTLIKVLKA